MSTLRKLTVVALGMVSASLVSHAEETAELILAAAGRSHYSPISSTR